MDDKWLHSMNEATEGECLNAADMRAYHAGILSPEQRHAVERHLLDCPLCALAWGDEELDPSEVERGAQVIAEMAWDRVAEKKKRRRGAFIWMSAAAGIAMLITIGWLFMQKADHENMDSVFAESLGNSEYEPEAKSAEPVDSRYSDSIQLAEGDMTTTGTSPMEELEKMNFGDGDKVALDRTQESPARDLVKESPSVASPKPDYVMDQMGGDRGPADFADADEDDDAGDNADAFYSLDDYETEVEEEEIAAAFEDKPVGGYDFGDDVANGADNYNDGAGLRDDMSGFTGAELTDSSQTDLIAIVEEPNLQADPYSEQYLDEVTIAAEEVEITDNVRAAKAEREKSKDKGDTRAGRERSETVAAADEIAPAEPLDFRNAGDNSYRKKKYKEAGIAYERHLYNNPKDREARLLYAISLLRTDEAEKALTQLDILLEDRNSRFHEDAEWYKALAFIRLHRKSEAKTLLQKIIRENGKWASEAEDTLGKL